MSAFWANADSQGPDQPAHAQADLGLGCPLTELLGSGEYMYIITCSKILDEPLALLADPGNY